MVCVIQRFFPAGILLVILFANCHLAAAKTMEADLRGRLQGKVLTLRTPFQGDVLTFGPGGTPDRAGPVGTLSMDGGLIAERLSLKRDRLTIEGHRVVLVYVGGELKAGRTADRLRIGISFNPADTPSLEKALSLIFQADNERRVSPPPDIGHFESSRFECQSGHPPICRNKGTTEWKPKGEIDAPIEAGQLEDGEKVYFLSGATTAPKPLKTPDPMYPEGEGSARRGGHVEAWVVVDQRGLIHSVAVKSGDPAFVPASLAVLRHWRFEPAKLAGLPVACAINLEFSFKVF